MCEAMIEYGKHKCNAQTVSHRGQTALVAAAHKGMLKAVSLLLDLGADPNHKCAPVLHTALHQVAEFQGNEHVWICRLLIANGETSETRPLPK